MSQVNKPSSQPINDAIVLAKLAKLGKEIKAYRKKLHNMTIDELVLKSGVSARTISYLEGLPLQIKEMGVPEKIIKVRIDNLLRIAYALGMEVKLTIK
jgi:hypothetical protein